MEKERALKLMRDMLALMLKKEGSDLFITAGFPPAMKVKGVMTPMSKQPLSAEDSSALTRCIMNEKQVKEFEDTLECNFAIQPEGIGRFRCNAFVQRNCEGLVMRTITTEVPTMQKLGLPPVFKEVIMHKNGLVLMVGGTGSGKSTSLAAMIDKINNELPVHIVTIEDPIEYLHTHKKAMINQRELHSDTRSYPNALRSALREDPDVVLIGEMRDLETIESALRIAETGHLTFATLHTNSAPQTINRIIDVFPEHQQAQVRTQLSFVLEGIICQSLLPRASRDGRVLARPVAGGDRWEALGRPGDIVRDQGVWLVVDPAATIPEKRRP